MAVGRILEAAVLCNDAQQAAQETGAPTFSGDPTETALLAAVARAGFDSAAIRRAAPRRAAIPFDPGPSGVRASGVVRLRARALRVAREQ